jgi:hypothetical protein
VRIEAVGTGKSATVQAPLRETSTNCRDLPVVLIDPGFSRLTARQILNRLLGNP